MRNQASVYNQSAWWLDMWTGVKKKARPPERKAHREGYHECGRTIVDATMTQIPCVCVLSEQTMNDNAEIHAALQWLKVARESNVCVSSTDRLWPACSHPRRPLTESRATVVSLEPS